jgi:predicted transcriptional regulator
MNSEYLTVSQYMESKTTLQAKIAAYDKLIDAMENSIAEAMVSGHINQTEVDDGFMKVRLNYRNVGDMTKALAGLEALRQRYINRYNGRSTVLRGGQI